jgi:hypothetical protein
VQANQATCQRCGMPVYSNNQREMNPHEDFRGQTELPTWLESLRVNEQTNSPASDQSHFSMSELIDEGALPSWMRQEDGEMIEKGNSGKYPAWRPASMSAPHTDAENIPPEGLAARSLIDEQSLPSWVQSSTGPMPVTPDSPKNFSAASLIQPDDLPDWMKSMPQSPQTPVSQNSVWGAVQPPTNQTQANSPTPNPSYHNPSLPPQSIQNESTGVNASSLLDANSIPAWLREGDQTQAHGSGQSGQVSSGNSGLTGSSLIDANAIPGWLRSFDDQQQTNMQQAGYVRPYGTAPRIDNVRVPSRPRAENVPQEQSEVAANVFSSVLGVAASAPYFPPGESQAQNQLPGQGTAFPPQGLQSGQTQPPTGTQWNVAAQPPVSPANPQMQGYNPAVYQGGQQVVNPLGGNAGYPGMPQQPAGQNMSMGATMAQQPDANASNVKRAKRGFLDTIRSWFK